MNTRFADKLRIDSLLFVVSVSLLLLVPLAFSTAVYRTSTLPKFALLLCGASTILVALILAAITKRIQLSELFTAPPSRMIVLFCFVMAISTVGGQAPIASLFGSYVNQMGFLSYLCFFLIYFGLVTSISGHKRLIKALWAVAMVGLLAGAYATAQFFGRDPFLSASSYTFHSSGTLIIRPPGTVGHPDILANLLLYTWPVGVALARLSSGSARRIALASCGFSLLAILLSGTRGAWLGTLAGGLALVYMELRNRSSWKERLKPIGIALCVVVALTVVVTISSPVRRAVLSRARDVRTEGLTGSGRTYLWRDALKMVPRFSIVGCGPEAFSKVFPQYRSEELARYSAGISNESSHDTYLDATIAFGIAGGILYLAILSSTFYRLFNRRKYESSPSRQIITAGIAAALTGAAVHNVFIYDQISTGLFFYAFIALAVIASAADSGIPRDSATDRHAVGTITLGHGLFVVIGVVAVVASVWYSLSLLKCDRAIKQAYISASKGDLGALESNCAVATNGPDPTRAYKFAAAQAVLAYLTTLSPVPHAVAGDAADSADRSRAIEMGRSYAEQSLAQSLTPGDNYVLLAYFALCSGDTAALDASAKEAVRWDPFHLNARWLMAEALFAQGKREDAVREATFALSIRPGFDRAQSILVRARSDSERNQRMMMRASLVSERGNVAKAERLLKRAIRLSRSGCAECHRALALLYEQIDRREEAIIEWRQYEVEAPDKARGDNIAGRIASLQAKRK